MGSGWRGLSMWVTRREASVSDLLKICAESLRANIVTLPSGKYLAAGAHQFRTLWTRDFCHAVGGLLAIGEEQVARDHLSYLLANLRADGLVPRVVDNRLVQFRVAWQSTRKLVPILPALSFNEPLRPQYIDEHGSNAVDSNLLVLLACLKLRERAQGPAWWEQHQHQLKRAWHWYDHQLRDGLIWQAPFADWQDSAKREGFTFLTNLLYFITGERLRQLGWSVGFETTVLRERLQRDFLDAATGVYRSLMGSPVVSVEGNLIALDVDEFLAAAQKAQVWKALRQHELLVSAGGVIGRCGTPEWPRAEIAWHVKLARLERYHGALAWSWLMGLGLKVGAQMEDHEFVALQREKIRELLERDENVVEIYDPEKNWRPWQSWLLSAERPFSWGAGQLIEGLINSQS